MAAGKSDLVDLEVRVHHVTERAVLVSDDGERANAVWLPLSAIEIVMKECGLAEITVPEWLAVERGLV